MAITIKRARQIVKLVTDLSLVEDHDSATRDLEKARADKPMVGMEVGDTAVREAAQRVTDIEELMAESTLSFTLQAVDRLRWNQHVTAHPPREGDETDAAIGVDVSSLDDLMPETIKAVHDADGTPVDFDPVAEWPTLSAQLSDGQYNTFVTALVTVNRGTGAPKSQVASLVMRSSEKS